jgi:hypothetical protein
METTNIYDFLHFFNLIRIKPNMDFGGGWGGGRFCTIHFVPFVLSLRVEKGSQANTKVKCKKGVVACILFFSFNVFKLGFN